MPEGDTIHRHAAELGRAIVGRPVTALHARGASYGRLVGKPVRAAEARGKHLLIDVGEGAGAARVHVHLGMHGAPVFSHPHQSTIANGTECLTGAERIRQVLRQATCCMQDVDHVAVDRSRVVERFDRDQVVPSRDERVVLAALYFIILLIDSINRT